MCRMLLSYSYLLFIMFKFDKCILACEEFELKVKVSKSLLATFGDQIKFSLNYHHNNSISSLQKNCHKRMKFDHIPRNFLMQKRLRCAIMNLMDYLNLFHVPFTVMFVDEFSFFTSLREGHSRPTRQS